MADKKQDPLAALEAKLAAIEQQGVDLHKAREANAVAQRRLRQELRVAKPAQMGALADACGLAAYPLDVLGEVFLGIAVLLAKYVETPEQMRAQLTLLTGGKEP
jgi:hypothetical protein